LLEPPDDLDVIGPDVEERPRLLTGSAARRLARVVAFLHGLAERRRGWIAAGCAVLAGAAGAAVVLSLAAPVAPQDTPARATPAPAASQPGQFFVITSAMVQSVGTDGVFAWGTSGGRPWRLAVQDIAGPGYPCRPGVTVNGSDAEPLRPAGQYPRTPVGSPAFVTLGAAMPGTGFAFIQLAPDVDWVWADAYGVAQLPSGMQAVTVSECARTFRLVGFAYGLGARLRLHTLTASWQAPSSYSDPAGTLGVPQVDGIWQGPGSGRGPADSGQIGAGTVLGQGWSVRVTAGLAGDCYGLTTGLLGESAQQGTSERTYCAPVSTPAGLDAIVAFPFGFPDTGGQGYAYAVSVPGATARIQVRLADGQSQWIVPGVVAGREFAAFFVAAPARLAALFLFSSAGQVIGATGATPKAGYLQFQP
jgi:hypothetical protein